MVIQTLALYVGQVQLLPPTHITLYLYGCIYHKNMSRYIYISEEYYGSERVLFFPQIKRNCSQWL
jgi:hypothetical protein